MASSKATGTSSEGSRPGSVIQNPGNGLVSGPFGAPERPGSGDSERRRPPFVATCLGVVPQRASRPSISGHWPVRTGGSSDPPACCCDSAGPRDSRSTHSRSFMPGLKQAAYLAGSDTGVPVLGLRPTRARRKRTVKLPKPRISMRPPPARHSAMCSSIIFTAVSTSRPTNWGCFRVMRWTGSDFVIGPLWRVRWGRERWRRRGRGARTPRADPSPILIDGVNDERIQPNGSFPDHAGRALVPCFAIRGHEPPVQSTTSATALECGSARSRRARPPRAAGCRAGWCGWTRAPQCAPRPRGPRHFAGTR